MKLTYVGYGWFAVPVASDSGIRCHECRSKATVGYLRANAGMGHCYCESHAPQELLNLTVAEDFAASLSKLIADTGLSVSAFAEKHGLNQQTLQNYTSGKRRPTWDMVQQLAKALGVPTDTFRDRS